MPPPLCTLPCAALQELALALTSSGETSGQGAAPAPGRPGSDGDGGHGLSVAALVCVDACSAQLALQRLALQLKQVGPCQNIVWSRLWTLLTAVLLYCYDQSSGTWDATVCSGNLTY